MNNSNLNDEIKNKIKDAINKTIKDDLIDVSDFNITESLNKDIENSNETKISLNNNNSSEKEDSNFIEELKNTVNDVKKTNDNIKPQGELNKTQNGIKEHQNGNNSSNNIEKLKKDAKPAIDGIKKAGNELKEQGKNAAAKVGGAAISTLTKGVVPQKLGEKVSKKILDKAEVNNKKRLNKINNNLSEIKDKLKNNEKLEKAKNKVKKTADKTKKTIKAIKFVRTIKKMAPAIITAVCVIAFIGIIISIVTIIQSYLPGVFGDVKSEVESENYSKRDKKILEKLEKINKKYPNAKGDVVMSAVSYPYYELLQSEYIKNSSENEDKENEDDEKDMFEQSDSIFETDDSSTELSEEENEYQNDPYLNLYSKKKYRDKYAELMEIYNSKGEEEFKLYLNETYFNEEDGYKKLLKDVSDENKDESKEIMQKDIYNNASLFSKYMSKIEVCYTSLVSAGTVEVDDIIKSGVDNILIDVKEENCTSDVDSCASWYASPISLLDYVKGVTNTEISIDANTSLEKIKTQMIMVKSLVLGRYSEQKWQIKQNELGQYIIPIRANTNDQDYCDYKVGCSEKLSGNTHGPASVAVQELLDLAWQETKDEYIYDSNSERTVANYKKDYDEYCVKGKCLITEEFNAAVDNNLTYQEIIAQAFSDFQFITIEQQGYATLKISGNKQCVSVGGATGGIPDDQFVYFDQKDFLNPFCGLTDGSTIASSGCGVTSMAMVLANLTYETNINPVITMDEAHKGGYCSVDGTYVGYFYKASEKYGLTAKALSTNSEGAKQVIETLKKGGLVIANVNQNSPFTNGGHYIVIRKVDSDGKIYVADPNHKELFNTAYNINDFIDKNWFSSGNWISFIGPRSSEFEYKITSDGEPGVATGYLGNPLNKDDLKTDYSSKGNATSFPKYLDGACHGAVDIETLEGTTVYAMDGGTVIQTNDYSNNCIDCVGSYDSYGNLVVIDHGNGYITRYAHLSKRMVNEGDIVSKGELIGYSGNTGYSTGPHLHIELEKKDLLNQYGRTKAKCEEGFGLLNPTKYINSTTSYVGQTK